MGLRREDSWRFAPVVDCVGAWKANAGVLISEGELRLFWVVMGDWCVQALWLWGGPREEPWGLISLLVCIEKGEVPLVGSVVDLFVLELVEEGERWLYVVCRHCLLRIGHLGQELLQVVWVYGLRLGDGLRDSLLGSVDGVLVPDCLVDFQFAHYLAHLFNLFHLARWDKLVFLQANALNLDRFGQVRGDGPLQVFNEVTTQVEDVQVGLRCWLGVEF